MAKKVGRNDPCPCGSGKKYKNCCERSRTSRIWPKLGQIGAGLVCLFALYVVTGLYVTMQPGAQVTNYILELPANADPNSDNPFGELPPGFTVRRVDSATAAELEAQRAAGQETDMKPGIRPVPGYDYDQDPGDGVRRLTKEEMDSIFEDEFRQMRGEPADSADTTSP